VFFRELSVRKHARSRARAQMRAATGERSLPRRFPIRHILFRNLNYASTSNARAIKSSGTSNDSRTTDAFVMVGEVQYSGVQEYQDSNESLVTRTAEPQRELDGDP
jgi:hypothetical protein